MPGWLLVQDFKRRAAPAVRIRAGGIRTPYLLAKAGQERIAREKCRCCGRRFLLRLLPGWEARGEIPVRKQKNSRHGKDSDEAGNFAIVGIIELSCVIKKFEKRNLFILPDHIVI